jgi:hypothetical protein
VSQLQAQLVVVFMQRDMAIAVLLAYSHGPMPPDALSSWQPWRLWSLLITYARMMRSSRLGGFPAWRYSWSHSTLFGISRTLFRVFETLARIKRRFSCKKTSDQDFKSSASSTTAAGKSQLPDTARAQDCRH